MIRVVPAEVPLTRRGALGRIPEQAVGRGKIESGYAMATNLITAYTAPCGTA
jgi:hypothetical protein